ncbi:hypothetical protein A3K71_01790 [archaeon RBG_16_50_20]|nr:MAG: hypothetical protein A3K71_01790 [archaeon RBG_16_50_20]
MKDRWARFRESRESGNRRKLRENASSTLRRLSREKGDLDNDAESRVVEICDSMLGRLAGKETSMGPSISRKSPR